MTAWALVVVGLLGAGVGTTVAVGSAAVGRVELMRWISHRLRGAALASNLFSSRGRIQRVATAVGALGVLVAGTGLAGILRGLPIVFTSGVIVFAAVPALVMTGYVVPRVAGRRWAERIVRLGGPWMERLAGVLRPLLPSSPDAGESDLASLLRAGRADDVLDEQEAEVVAGVVAFTERLVKDVMTPRTDIVALSEGADLHEVARLFAESGYSRIPVYREHLDDIRGMIYAFDLLKVTPGAELLLRPVTVTPGSKTCASLLVEMQRERRQFAVVLDEFGGTAGIVTLENLLEELVGRVFVDDGRATAVDKTEPELAILDASTPIHEVAAQFGLHLPEGTETLGGLIAKHAGRIPEAGDRFTLGPLEFDVLAATPTRIERVVVRRGPVKSVVLAPNHSS